MRKDCKIIQDLLPNYIENVTNEETNEFVEEHMKECEECKKIYASMKESMKMNIKTIEAEKEVRYMKKFNKQLRILKFSIITILIIFTLVIGYKTAIMTSLSNKASKNLEEYSTNYHIKYITYMGDEMYHTETYYKDNDYFSVTKIGTIGEIYSENIHYRKSGEEIDLYNSAEQKIQSSKVLGRPNNIPPIFNNNFLSNFKISFRVNIGTANIDSKKCYVIKDKSFDKYVDKDTGLIIKEINTITNATTEFYFYEFGTVKDSDIVRPDTTGYIEEDL